jgi:hypothetical protein
MGTALPVITVVSIFLISYLEIIFNAEFVGKFMMYHYTKFYMSNSNGSLVIAIRPKDKYRFNADAILSYILQNEIP